MPGSNPGPGLQFPSLTALLGRASVKAGLLHRLFRRYPIPPLRLARGRPAFETPSRRQKTGEDETGEPARNVRSIGFRHEMAKIRLRQQDNGDIGAKLALNQGRVAPSPLPYPPILV